MNRAERRRAQRAQVQTTSPAAPPPHVHQPVSLSELRAQAFHVVTGRSQFGDLSACQDIRLDGTVADVVADLGESPETTPEERSALATLLRTGWLARLFVSLEEAHVADELVEVIAEYDIHGHPIMQDEDGSYWVEDCPEYIAQAEAAITRAEAAGGDA